MDWRLAVAAGLLVLASCSGRAPTAAEPSSADQLNEAPTTEPERPAQSSPAPPSVPPLADPSPPPDPLVDVDRCLADAAAESVPTTVTAALETAVIHPAFSEVELSASVWIEGWGEVLSIGPDRTLVPASNQKLLVAIVANDILAPDARLRTTIERQGEDLVLRAGGDPTLTTADIDVLAKAVATKTRSADRLIVDVSPYPQEPRAEGWLDWQIPTYVGPLSGLVLDDNRWNIDESYLGDPAVFNGHRAAERLAEAGVDVGSVDVAASPAGEVLAEHLSPTIDELVTSMLVASDNQHADLLLMELGRATKGTGTLAAGAAVIEDVLGDGCLRSSGASDDGSGLSRQNRRSAQELQQVLQTLDGDAREQLEDQLPIGGRSGTMGRRFESDPGRVVAKTGTVIGGRALSGYTTTDSGRDVVFSVIVNGEADAASASLPAIDELVTTILRIET